MFLQTRVIILSLYLSECPGKNYPCHMAVILYPVKDALIIAEHSDEGNVDSFLDILDEVHIAVHVAVYNVTTWILFKLYLASYHSYVCVLIL